MLINLAQFTGAFFGVLLSYLILMPSHAGGVDTIPVSWLSPLCPVGVNEKGEVVNDPCEGDHYRDRSAFFFQVFGTFLFIVVVCLVKDATTAPTKDDMLISLIVAVTLISMVGLADNQGGASYNPAVALAEIVFNLAVSEDSTVYEDSTKQAMKHYLWIFLFAPYLGAALAALFHLWHVQNIKVMGKYKP